MSAAEEGRDILRFGQKLLLDIADGDAVSVDAEEPLEVVVSRGELGEHVDDVVRCTDTILPRQFDGGAQIGGVPFEDDGDLVKGFS